MTSSLNIFTDGSVNTQAKVGYGAYIAIADLNTPLETLNKSIKLKRFEQTSSTRLELQTVLWAINEIRSSSVSDNLNLTVYTDSQNIVGLPARREQLEKTDFYSTKNKQLANHDLYREFYRLTLALNCRFEKVAGHRASGEKDIIDRLFALVDKASRRALRTESDNK